MPSFHYRALNTTNAELSGVIEAPDEQAARLKLNELNLSIVTIEVVSGVAAAQTDETKVTFEFEAKDKNGKKVVGTIVAQDAVAAYKRLFEVYQLNVLGLADATTPAGKKKAEMQTVLAEVRAAYEELHFKKEKEKAQEAEKNREQEVERAQLEQTIESTITRVKAFLSTGGTELIPEERETIQSYIDQLMRIKDSTNVEHVRTTCTRMLEHIQRQELFIHEQEKIRESSRLKLDTKNLLDELKKTGLNKDIQFGSVLQSMRTNSFLSPLAHLFPVLPPELRKIKDEIRAVNKNMRTYLSLIFTGKSKALKLEAWESIKTLWNERSRLKASYSQLKDELDRKTEAAAGSLEQPSQASFIGWTLFFLLVAYIGTYPLTVKEFGLTEVPVPVFFYKTTFTKPLTLFLFMLYCTLSMRRFWLKKGLFTTLGVISGAMVVFLLITINLM